MKYAKAYHTLVKFGRELLEDTKFMKIFVHYISGYLELTNIYLLKNRRLKGSH